MADVQGIVDAVEAQSTASDKLGWPAVRPVIQALRRYWEEGGFAVDGSALPAVLRSLPASREALFSATVRALVGGGYLAATSPLAANDIPAEVEFTDRAHAVLDGWPGATATDLGENLMAVLTAEVATEEDPARKRRLQSLLTTVKDLGATAHQEYFDAIHHSAAVVGVNTSAMIEAAIVGRGVHVLRTKHLREAHEGRPHFEYLVSAGGGLLRIADAIPDHVAGLAGAIRGDDAAECRQRSERFLRAFVRPHGLEHSVTPLMVDALESLPGTVPGPRAIGLEDLQSLVSDV